MMPNSTALATAALFCLAVGVWRNRLSSLVSPSLDLALLSHSFQAVNSAPLVVDSIELSSSFLICTCVPLSSLRGGRVGGGCAFLPQCYTDGTDLSAPVHRAFLRCLAFRRLSHYFFFHHLSLIPTFVPHTRSTRTLPCIAPFRLIPSHLPSRPTMGASSVASDDSNNDVSDFLSLR